MKIKLSKKWIMKHAMNEVGCSIAAGNPCFEQELFDEWFEELKRVMFLNGFKKKSLESLDKLEWKTFFDDDLTPAEALMEDLSNA